MSGIEVWWGETLFVFFNLTQPMLTGVISLEEIYQCGPWRTVWCDHQRLSSSSSFFLSSFHAFLSPSNSYFSLCTCSLMVSPSWCYASLLSKPTKSFLVSWHTPQFEQNVRRQPSADIIDQGLEQHWSKYLHCWWRAANSLQCHPPPPSSRLSIRHQKSCLLANLLPLCCTTWYFLHHELF